MDLTSRPTVAREGGLHRDGDKPRLVDMIPPELLLECGRIFAQNNAPRSGYPDGKYPDIQGRPNFRGGIQTTKLLDSALRHLLALATGENTDPDSGYDHAAHLLCNLAMFWWTREHRPDLDNRDWSGPDLSDDTHITVPGYTVRYPVQPAEPPAGGRWRPRPLDDPTCTGEPYDLSPLWATVGRGGGTGEPSDW